MEEYEEQLKQIQLAIEHVENDDDRRNLESLENDLKQLISLSFLESLGDGGDNSNNANEQTEIEDETPETSRLDQHEHLVDQKFRAPYTINGQTSFHNAFITSIEDAAYDDVFVKIFFLQPIVDRMKVCDFFLEGKCQFSKDCKYSHGEIVVHSELQPYSVPDYDLLKRSIHVHVKIAETSLWTPATVMSCDRDAKVCQVKLQHSGKLIDAKFEDILPPLRGPSDDLTSSSSSDESEDFETSLNSSITQFHTCSNTFGEWEKFTNGFGSKMLKKLGYQEGEGLGKRSDGRIEPVEAKIYVTGKSIDWNMERNAVNGEKNMTVEEKCKRESSKYFNKSSEGKESSGKSKDNLFAFINKMNEINKKPEDASKAKVDIKAQSKQQLNQNNFQITEEIKKIEKSLIKLKESQRRLKNDPTSLKHIELQLKSNESEIAKLKSQLTAIDREQEMRKGRNKLTVF